MRRSASLSTLVALAALPALSIVGCASSPDPGGDTGEATIEAINPTSGETGTRVTVRASGFPPGTTVDIGFGPPASEYEVLAQAQADGNGDVIASVDVPGWAEGGRRYVFVVADTDARPKAVSDAFHVTDEDGRVRVTGRITDEGVECTALRSDPGNELYTLAGDTGGLEPGDRVTVEGTIADMSFCQQGTTIDVEEINRRE